MPFIDSHCHINFPDLANNIDEVLAQMKQNDVQSALCVSVNLTDFPQVLALAERYENIYASVGVHPDYEDEIEPGVAQLVALAQHEKIIAIGETGLDYFRLTGDLEWQRARFRNHIRAARECILIETDAPYLAPVPYRGKLNQPAYVKHVAEEIALLRGISVDEVGRATCENFARLFNASKLSI
jgi:Tat protein secretion system quality control protein TatD with DNase activity